MCNTEASGGNLNLMKSAFNVPTIGNRDSVNKWVVIRNGSFEWVRRRRQSLQTVFKVPYPKGKTGPYYLLSLRCLSVSRLYFINRDSQKAEIFRDDVLLTRHLASFFDKYSFERDRKSTTYYLHDAGCRYLLDCESGFSYDVSSSLIHQPGCMFKSGQVPMCILQCICTFKFLL